jgi:hypothetical protein
MNGWRERLGRVSGLQFEAVSAAEMTDWNGRGEGDVKVRHLDRQLIFEESGLWQPREGSAISFTNCYRWSFSARSIALEHLRFGPDRPVYLFDLIPDPAAGGEQRLISERPHPCGEDRYEASLSAEPSEVQLGWTIVGPRKRTEILYRYRFELN